MRLNIRYATVLLFSTMLLTTSCENMSSGSSESGPDLTPLVAKQELFEKKLNQIVKKIDNLQVSVNKIKSAPPSKNDKPQQNKRKPADPDYVHNIPQGDSYFIGNPDAVVTITEFFDFQ